MLRAAPALLFVWWFVSSLLLSREAAAITQVDEPSPEVVIVNGSLSAPGAIRDRIELRGAVANLQVPYPESFSAERLLNQHNLLLNGESACRKQFCLVSESIEAQLLAQPEMRYLVGLGFASQLSGAPWQRMPVNLVAVVDRSSSMQGARLELAKRSLTELVRHLTPQDQLSIVVYGSTAETHVPPTMISPQGRKQLLAAIDELQSDAGSAVLEVGLAFGYRLARAASGEFDGTDRVMLFTDEPPDEGNASAGGFLALARRGAQSGVGLTTVGVAIPFNAQLAASLGSVRGANLLFLHDDSDVAQVFGTELHMLTSELAHEVRITITPANGYNIAGVYGAPGALLRNGSQRNLEVTIPTAFLSSAAGGLFVALAKQPGIAEPAGSPAAAEPLARVAVVYTPLNTTRPEAQTLLVAPPAIPSTTMQLGRLLIDEFTTLRRATSAYHVDHDQQAAFQHLHAFAIKLRDSRLPGLDLERRLVNSLEERLAFLSGHADHSELVRSRISRLWGVWRVRSVQGRTDFRANERIEFTPDSKFRFFEKESGRHVLASVSNISASRQQILMDYSGVVYNYEVRGSELVLQERPGTLVFLQRSSLD